MPGKRAKMYKEKTNEYIRQMDELLMEIRADNKILLHNPLSRNRMQLYEDIEKMRKVIFEYKKFLKWMPMKYEYKNRGKERWL